MISFIIIIAFTVIALVTAFKNGVTKKTSYGNDVMDITKLGKPLLFFVVGLLLGMIQPYAIEKIDAGNKGLKINLVGNQRGVASYQYKTGWVMYNTWTEQVLDTSLTAPIIAFFNHPCSTSDIGRLKLTNISPIAFSLKE